MMKQIKTYIKMRSIVVDKLTGCSPVYDYECKVSSVRHYVEGGYFWGQNRLLFFLVLANHCEENYPFRISFQG